MEATHMDELMLRLTLEEKLSLLAAESTWRTGAIERLGIPRLKVGKIKAKITNLLS